MNRKIQDRQVWQQFGQNNVQQWTDRLTKKKKKNNKKNERAEI